MSTSPAETKVATATPESRSGIDILTIIAIAIVTYLASTFAHEALGHGLAALISGLHVTRLTSVDLEVNFTNVSLGKVRFVAAAGCIANVILAIIAIMLFRYTRRGSPATRFFLWLLATNNLLIPGGYLMVLTFLGIGDWSDFVQGLPSVLVWKIGLTLLGVLISFAGLWWGGRNIDIFLGPEKRLRSRRSLTLTLTAYLAGGTANTLAGALNPTSPMLILISAAASSFGGTIWLLWINSFARNPRPTTPEVPLIVSRSWLWIGLGVVALLIYFLVLGPGLPRSTFL